MAQEIELKLSLPHSAHQQFREHPLLDQLKVEDIIVRELDNLYFDTPDLALNKHRIALRIRHQGARFIQTLKTKGSSSGGLHRRNEWEWDVQKPELDPSLLPKEQLPSELDVTELQPAFNTNFERTTWLLQMEDADEKASIEVVLDIGSARSRVSNREDEISEVELELKSGSPRLIYVLALELAKTIPLRITQVSKGERGYRLDSPLQLPQFSTAEAEQTPLNRLQELLECSQRLIESYEFTPQSSSLVDLLKSMEEIQALLDIDTVHLPAPLLHLYQQSCQGLRMLITPWLLPEKMTSEEQKKQRLPQIQQLLEGLPLTQALLQLSYSCFMENLSSD